MPWPRTSSSEWHFFAGLTFHDILCVVRPSRLARGACAYARALSLQDSIKQCVHVRRRRFAQCGQAVSTFEA